MNAHVALEAISTTTGQPIEVSNPLPYEGQGQGLATIDSANGVYYIIGTNVSKANAVNLVGVSVATGQVASETPLPFQSSALIGVGQYVAWDSTRGQAVAVGQDFTKNEYVLVRVDPERGHVDELATFPDTHDLDVLGGGSVYDAGADIYWFLLALNVSDVISFKMYGFSASTGQLENILDNPDYIEAMVYDPNAGRVVALGARVQKGVLQRTLVFFDSETGTFTQFGTIPHYAEVLSDVLTLDTHDRVLYFFGHKSNQTVAQETTQRLSKACQALDVSETRDLSLLECQVVLKARGGYAQAVFGTDQGSLPSMNLVAFSLQSLKVLAEPQACATFPECAWSLEFANVQQE